MSYADLPYITNRPIYAARKLVLIDNTSLDGAGVPVDLTTTVFVGEVRSAPHVSATKLGDLVIMADSVGNFLATISATDASAIVAGAVGEVAYYDIKGTDSGDEPITWYAGQLFCNDAVTA